MICGATWVALWLYWVVINKLIDMWVTHMCCSGVWMKPKLFWNTCKLTEICGIHEMNIYTEWGSIVEMLVVGKVMQILHIHFIQKNVTTHILLIFSLIHPLFFSKKKKVKIFTSSETFQATLYYSNNWQFCPNKQVLATLLHDFYFFIPLPPNQKALQNKQNLNFLADSPTTSVRIKGK